VSRQQQLQQETYYQVLAILEQDPGISQRALAKRLGISLGGVNYSLKALIEKGWLKAQNFQKNENKLGYAYLLTPAGVLEKSKLTAAFLKRKMAEYEALKHEIARLQSVLECSGVDANSGSANLEG